jgi:hypothetical protein
MNEPVVLFAETVVQPDKLELCSRSARPLAVAFQVTEALPPPRRTLSPGAATVDACARKTVAKNGRQNLNA